MLLQIHLFAIVCNYILISSSKVKISSSILFAFLLIVGAYTSLETFDSVDARDYRLEGTSETAQSTSERHHQHYKLKMESVDKDAQSTNGYYRTDQDDIENTTDLGTQNIRIPETMEQSIIEENYSMTLPQEVIANHQQPLIEEMSPFPVVIGGQTNENATSPIQEITENSLDPTPKFTRMPSSSVSSLSQGQFSIQSTDLDTQITLVWDFLNLPMTSGGSTFGDRITIDFGAIGATSAVGFECTYDNHPSFTCGPAISISGVSLDDNTRSTQHTFKVSARNSSGFVDPTPAVFTWDRLRVGSIPNSIDGDLTLSHDGSLKRLGGPAVDHVDSNYVGNLHWNRTGQIIPQGTWQIACEKWVTNLNDPLRTFSYSGPLSVFLKKNTDFSDIQPYMEPWQYDYYGFVSPEMQGIERYLKLSWFAWISWPNQLCETIGNLGLGNAVDPPLSPVEFAPDGSISSEGTFHFERFSPLASNYDWEWDVSLKPDPMPDIAITAMFDRTGEPISPGGTTASGGFTAYFEGAVDYVNGVYSECSVDNSPFQNCANFPTNGQELGEGTHTFKVRTVDGAGYKDTSPATFTWNVEKEKLDLRIFKPDQVEISETEEESAGAALFLNNDNDDIDNLIDLNDNNGVHPVDDDLIRLDVKTPSTATLSSDSGREKLNIWRDPNKVTKLTLPAQIDSSTTLWVEGINPSTTPADVRLRLEQIGDPVSRDIVSLSVLEVKDIRITGKQNSYNDDDILDSNAHPSGPHGLRVFPDARIEDLGFPVIGLPRDRVNIEVELNVNVPFELPVFARSFDVDDPSIDRMPIDDEAVIEDNRGTVNNFRSGLLIDGNNIQDNDGIISVSFEEDTKNKIFDLRVSMNQGDNYRVVAHNDRDYLINLKNNDGQGDGMNIIDSSSGSLVADEYISSLLTIWRKLHIELDTMEGLPSRTPRERGDDPTVLPKLPDTGGLNEYLNRAYIAVFVEPDGRDNSRFVYHLTTNELRSNNINAPCFQTRDLTSNSNEYWVAYILSAFEGPANFDRDPDIEEALLGITPRLDSLDDNCIVIFQEVIRDFSNDRVLVQGGINREETEEFTIAHEMGHVLSLIHPGLTQYTCDTDFMGEDWPNDIIDITQNGQFDPRQDQICPKPSISDQNLNILRKVSRPGIEPIFE